MREDLRRFARRSPTAVRSYHKLRTLVWARDRSKRVEAYLRSHVVRRLQIGTGSNVLPGWLNTDVDPFSPEVIYLDATRPFDFKGITFDYVFSEHIIEHLSFKDAQFMLRECYRILKPGGVIRIATPSLEALLGLYNGEQCDVQRKYIKWITDTHVPDATSYSATFVINNAFRNWGHQFIYDRATLQRTLEDAGFRDVSFHGAGESDDEALRGIESHGLAIGDEELNRFETMVVEAIRPVASSSSGLANHPESARGIASDA